MNRTSLLALGACVIAVAACGAEPAPSRPSSSTTTTPSVPPLPDTELDTVGLDPAEAERLVAEDPLWADALRIHYDALVIDGHADTPTLMLDDGYALGERHATAHLDLPRMEEGGLDGVFFSIYVARSFGEGDAATARAEAMIAEVRRQVGALDGARLATTADEVLAARQAGQTAILMGLEGGHALQGSPDVLRQLAAEGLRYVTLTHSNTNAFADASTDVARWGGLNDLGRELVAEMNRLGVLVDLSHVSDATFDDALAASRAPVILSHSSSRALHAHVRNASDDMLRALAAQGGVAMVNFYPLFVGEGATVEDVVDHIDHAVQVAGVDHVGLGSDFDGVPDLPDGLGDVTRLPWITYGLLKRGYAEADVRKILGGNVLRVLREAEQVAAEMAAD